MHTDRQTERQTDRQIDRHLASVYLSVCLSVYRLDRGRPGLSRPGCQWVVIASFTNLHTHSHTHAHTRTRTHTHTHIYVCVYIEEASYIQTHWHPWMLRNVIASPHRALDRDRWIPAQVLENGMTAYNQFAARSRSSSRTRMTRKNFDNLRGRN